jgi:Protein of unknown function (DUF2000)
MAGRHELPDRCVVVLDEGLPRGLAANAAAVLAVTLGARVNGLVGADYADADGHPHAGLIPFGLPVLRAPAARLRELRARASGDGVGVIDFPAAGQRTVDYDEFTRTVGSTPSASIEYAGVALYGERRAVARLTGSLGLLR